MHTGSETSEELPSFFCFSFFLARARCQFSFVRFALIRSVEVSRLARGYCGFSLANILLSHEICTDQNSEFMLNFAKFIRKFFMNFSFMNLISLKYIGSTCPLTLSSILPVAELLTWHCTKGFYRKKKKQTERVVPKFNHPHLETRILGRHIFLHPSHLRQFHSQATSTKRGRASERRLIAKKRDRSVCSFVIRSRWAPGSQDR